MNDDEPVEAVAVAAALEYTPDWLRWITRVSIVFGIIGIAVTAWIVGVGTIFERLRAIGPWFLVLLAAEATATCCDEAGIYWHSLAEALRRHGLDYLSAPLNMTASVGGTLGVGGIDINSPRLGCSADQALAIKIVTPTGEVLECSEKENTWWFNRVLLGYGQFGIITEATLRIRPFTPLTMRYFYYGDLLTAMEDLVMLCDEDAADYTGILTMLDRAVNLLVAFDSEEREKAFFKKWRPRLRGFGELGFASTRACTTRSDPGSSGKRSTFWTESAPCCRSSSRPIICAMERSWTVRWSSLRRSGNSGAEGRW